MIGAILAGGSSGRMGVPKQLLRLGDKTLLERAVDRFRPYAGRIVVAGGDVRTAEADLVGDALASGGPLAGIHAALAYTQDTCAVVACDMPFFSPDLLLLMEHEMGDALVAVPKVGPYYEPLHALYRPECILHIEDLLQSTSQGGARGRGTKQGRRSRVTDLFSRVKVHVTTEGTIRQFDDPRTIFFNINWPQDYLAAIEMSRRVESPTRRSLQDMRVALV